MAMNQSLSGNADQESLRMEWEANQQSPEQAQLKEEYIQSEIAKNNAAINRPVESFQPQGSIADAYGQGVFGLGDEIAGVYGGVKGAFDQDTTFGERYERDRDAAKADYNAYAEREPAKALMGELAMGSVIPGSLAYKAAKAGSNLGTVGKMIGMGVGGAAEGALYGAGSADPGQRSEGAKTGAVIGGIASPALSGVGSVVANKVANRQANKRLKRVAPTREELRDASSEIYKNLDDMRVTVSNYATEELANKITSKARQFGYHPKIHPKVGAAIEEVERLATMPATLKELDTARRIMGQAASSIEPAEKKLAMELIDIIDDRMENLSSRDVLSGKADAQRAGQLYQQARNLWQRNRKAEVLEDAVERAKLQDSGFENGLRRQFSALLRNKKKKLRGFSDEEIKMMERVANGTFTGNILKFLGKFGIMDKGGATSMVGASIGGGAGFAAGGVPGMIALPLAGQAAKMGSRAMTKNNADIASAAIRSGGGPVQSPRGKARTLYDAASIYAPQALMND